jgi:hypothetical protein
MQQRLDSIAELSQWERAELGRDLRRLGLSYGEIGDLVPASKATIARWCRDIELTEAQRRSILERTGSRQGVPRDTQRKRREHVASIVESAQLQVTSLAADPFWLAGLTIYWAEGFKTERALGMSNSDPDLLRYFLKWCRRYHNPDAEFRSKLNLHAGNDEGAAIGFWAEQMGLQVADFTKTFIKPDGTGHRKNHLPYGVCQLRMRRSADAFHRTRGWIDGVRRLGLTD